MKSALITGAGGMLAFALRRELEHRGVTVHALTRADLDVTDETAVHKVVRALRPDTIFQCAAYTRVDDAESDEGRAFDVNVNGAQYVSDAARETGARFVYPSTDYVFDGESDRPYLPASPVNPINAYGRTKAAGEERAAHALDYLVVRLSWLYGPGGRNFVRTVATRLDEGKETRVVSDQTGCPTWTIDAAAAVVALAGREIGSGIYHWTNSGVASWFDLAKEIAATTNTRHLIERCRTDEFNAPAARPKYSVLDCSFSFDLIGPAREWRSALTEALNSKAY